MIEKERANVHELAVALTAAFPKLDGTEKRIALAAYRRLARGVPASPAEIADDAGADLVEVRRVLGDWIGVYTDEERRVVAFWGLAIPRMKHGFEVDGVRLHAWCAWDTLFLPELLQRTARVDSACATSGQPVRLIVSPAGVESAEPASPFLSFLAPEASCFREDVIGSFCHYVHFFRSRQDGEAWIARNPRTFLLTLREAEALARGMNRLRFGEAMERRS